MYGVGSCGTAGRMRLVKRTASAEYMKQNSHPGRGLNFEIHKVWGLSWIVVVAIRSSAGSWIPDLCRFVKHRTRSLPQSRGAFVLQRLFRTSTLAARSSSCFALSIRHVRIVTGRHAKHQIRRGDRQHLFGFPSASCRRSTSMSDLRDAGNLSHSSYGLESVGSLSM